MVIPIWKLCYSQCKTPLMLVWGKCRNPCKNPGGRGRGSFIFIRLYIICHFSGHNFSVKISELCLEICNEFLNLV